jgi:putative nucleotidyltransferase with HDIG domain
MGASPTFQNILDRIESEKGRYISNHSTMVAHIACAIARGMTWSSDVTYYKLTMAAMLHDITLVNEDLAKIQTLTELSEKGDRFKPSEIDLYKRHVSDAAKIAQEFTEVPPDVDTIILQHHERPDGTGFPRRLSGPYINNLSAVFIIAHEIVQQTLIEGKDLPVIIRALTEKYESGAFKKIMGSVVALFAEAQSLKKTG